MQLLPFSTDRVLRAVTDMSLQSTPLFQKSLLQWYRKNRRNLPWRRTKDPYKIWISEVMLQQTTVEAVIPYFKRFLRRFPDVSSLASAKEETVLSLWSGLGYYSRARNLHRAAKMLVGKPFPRTVEELQSLPGIGRYTAGAIASIAFDQRAAILDGNVIRVLSRLFAMSDDPRTSKGRERFWKKAGEILPPKHCGDFNQALMELGATVCLPTNPQCARCPVRGRCAAREEGRPELYPKGRRKVSYRDVRMAAAVVLRGDKILMVRRPGHGILKGLWEFPMTEGGETALKRRWSVEIIRELPQIRHSVLNSRLVVSPFLSRLTRRDQALPAGLACRQTGRQVPSGGWFRPSEIRLLPTSSMNRKILERI
jgi:A/G-specific adenine glycosylase